MASAEALVVLALQEREARYRWQHVTAKGGYAGNGHGVGGLKSVVPSGDEADAFIVPARLSGAGDDAAGIDLFLVEGGADRVRGYPTRDGGRAADLVLDNTPATLINADGHAVLERAIDLAIAADCAEAVGVMDMLVALTAEYMNTRK